MNTTKAIFHQGEIAIQQRLGVAEKMAKFAPMVVRDHMPEQHRQFYESLPMLFVGHSDQNHQVWASVLSSNSSFIRSDDNKSLSINVHPFNGDPLKTSLTQFSSTNTQSLKLGLLGIELETRRRNRLSGQLSKTTGEGFNIDVVQTFGNCPQYIQSRTMIPAKPKSENHPVETITAFDESLTEFIQQSDTFFVASSSDNANATTNEASQGADVSHRGGRPGFVRVDNHKTLTIPDYLGNNHFNTLGNFKVNPSAGLLFINFDTGDIITLTGKAEILWDEPEQQTFRGAERLWQFTLEKGYRLPFVMPWRYKLQNCSPNSQMTGTWQEAEAQKRRETQKQGWINVTISKVHDESQNIRSFYLTPENGAIPLFAPGQFIPVKLIVDGESAIRTYSVSSSPLDPFLRISVKKEGKVSSWMHAYLKPGHPLAIQLPEGSFTLSQSPEKPAVLLSAGVGITPMISMLRHIVKDGIRTRSRRPVIMFNAFRKHTDQAFFTEINQLLQEANGDATVVWLLTNPEPGLQKGRDYSAQGRLSKKLLRSVLPIGQYEFYLCGPASFMQQSYDMLSELGVQDNDIKAEAFGPATLNRTTKPTSPMVETNADKAADNAVVHFENAAMEQAWTKADGTLLEFAESHGLTPAFSCRIGNCGSCKVTVQKGKVTHNGLNSFPVAKNEALLCCAVPAKTGNSAQPETLVLRA